MLEDDILARSREIKTDGYSMSIGEVLSMYRDGDLDVHPEFQRIFRWTDDQKSRLIESILLGIPIPTIFVAQRDDGIWDVIDGVQRLSTIFQFVGMYRKADGQLDAPSMLRGTEYLPSLEGFQWEVDPGNGRVFSEVLRRDFKRSKLDMRIIKKESDSDAKYDLFQRLNSGTQLSLQESRNCLLVMLNPKFFRWMDDLSSRSSFESTVVLSDRKEDEGFRQELVLRFLFQASFDGGTTELPTEIGEYITSWVRIRAKEFGEEDSEGLAELFDNVFGVIDLALGETAFRRYDNEKRRFLGPFSISAFEAITSGVAAYVAEWKASGSEGSERLAHLVRAMWSESDFKNNSGTGINARQRAPRLITFGREWFKP